MLVPWRADNARLVMESIGFRVTYATHARTANEDGTVAGSAKDRAADFMEAFTDDDVDLVFCASGGAGAADLLPLLDATRLREQNKAFVGNSDNVWLNHYLYQEVGLTSYYGVTFTPEMGEPGGPFPETLEYFRRGLTSDDDLVCKPMASRSSQFRRWSPTGDTDHEPRPRNHRGGWHWVRTGTGHGRLIGAEISCLVEMAARLRPQTDGHVLFWDVGLFNNRDVGDQFRELAELLPLEKLAGMMVGPDIRHTPEAWANRVLEVLDEVLPAATFPVVVNADVGHIDPKWVVPYGRRVRLDSSHGVVFPRRER